MLSSMAWMWRQWLRDTRTAGLRLMGLSVVLAVMVFSATAFLVDRMGRAVELHALQWLGGDVVIVSDRALPSAFESEAQARGLRVARSATFVSMARAPQALGGATRLVAVKAVSRAYPLRGQLKLASADPSAAAVSASSPPAGQVWVESSVLHALHLKVGDEILLGDAALRVAAVLLGEPDRGSAMASIAPRLLMNEADLAATHLIQPASRVTWRLAAAALDPRLNENVASRYEAWAQGRIKAQSLRGIHLETLSNGRPEMQQTLDRAMNFVRLVGLLAGLYAAVALGLAARDFALSRLDTCAVQRVLGASQRLIFCSYLFGLMSTCLAASVVGLGLGWLVHTVLAQMAASLVDMPLPPARAAVALTALGMGAVMGLGFGLPSVVQLAQVPALRVIRRQLGQPRALGILVAVCGLIAGAAMLSLAAANVRLAAYTLGGFLVAGLAFTLAAAITLSALRRLGASSLAQTWPLSWRLGVRQLGAYNHLIMVQITALSLSLLALVLLALVRASVLQDWRAESASDTPDRFIINIMPDQASDVRGYLQSQHVQRYDWYPMLRARLVTINHKEVNPGDFQQERAQRLLDREFNLSFAEQAPLHNEIVQGQWRAGDAGAWSVEEGLVKTLGLKLGDELGFDLAGERLEGRVDSVRKVDWASMRVNFFVMRPVSAMPDLPITYIAAFRAPESPQFDDTLSQRFPNLTVVDVAMALAQMQSMMRQLSQAVEFLFMFTLCGGLLVLLNALWLTREGRVREVAVMRTLGASNRLLHALQRNELLLLGGLAGLWGGGAALAMSWVLSRQVFHLEWQAHWAWWPLGVALGAGLAWGVGQLGLRTVLRRSVTQVFRQVA